MALKKTPEGSLYDDETREFVGESTSQQNQPSQSAETSRRQPQQPSQSTETPHRQIQPRPIYEPYRRTESLSEKILRIVGFILQVGVFLSFLYILFGTEIVRGSVRNIISLSLANKIPDTIYFLHLILPFFFCTLAIGFIGTVFIIKKKRINYLFYIAAILIQTTILTIWIKEYRSDVLPFQGILLILCFLTVIIIPGAILGMMRKKTATITLLIGFVLALMTRYGLNSGWFDYYSEKQGYTDGRAAVRYGNFLNWKWGFMDENGKVVIPCIYYDVLSFSEGFAAVRIDDKENGKWGFIGMDGSDLMPFEYDAVRSFTEGLAAVSRNGLWGFAGKTGKEIVQCKYDAVHSFKEGMAAVRIGIGNDGAGIWGFINKTGSEIIQPQYKAVGSFSEGLAAVSRSVTRADVNSRGQESNFRSIDLWGFIDKSGREVVPRKYFSVRPFSNGYSRVIIEDRSFNDERQYNKWGLVDRNGNLIVPCNYSEIGDFSGNLVKVTKRVGERNNNRINYNTRKYGVFDKNGNVIIPCNYDGVTIREDVIEVRTGRNNPVQYFDLTGRRVNNNRSVSNQNTNTQTESSANRASTTPGNSTRSVRSNTAVSRTQQADNNRSASNQNTNTQTESTARRESATPGNSTRSVRLNTAVNSNLQADTHSESEGNTWNCGVSTRINPGGAVSVKAELNDGALTISGKGAMANFNSTGAPWYNVRTSIKKILIHYGVTSIGNYAFSNCTELKSITLPEGITSVGLYSFNNCVGLTEIINYALTPLRIGSTVYSGVNIPAITMYVPAEAVEAYNRVSVNSGGYTVRAINNTSAEENRRLDQGAAATPQRYGDLNNPPAGVMRRTNPTTTTPQPNDTRNNSNGGNNRTNQENSTIQRRIRR